MFRSVTVWGAVFLLGLAAGAAVEKVTAAENRCLAFELFVAPGDPKPPLQQAVEQFVAERPGIGLRVMDPNDDAVRARLESVAKHFKREPQTPAVYCCGRLIGPGDDVAKLLAEIKSAATMTVYVRTGCPHCAQAKEWLPKFQAAYPGVIVVQRDIVNDTQAASDLQEVFKVYKIGGGSVPCFVACGQALVGFDQNSGERIEGVWKKWSHECKNYAPKKSSFVIPRLETFVSGFTAPCVCLLQADDAPPPLPLPGDEPPPPLPLPGEDPPPTGDVVEPSKNAAVGAANGSDSIKVPLLGNLEVSHLGLPIFTIAVGLIDGFNPCAMWVLLFLLSLLVNLRDRAKILAVAGTFVFISGAAYFSFMAAWLNVFMYIGLLKPVQIALALTAIVIGAIHIKDFFWFKQGVSLSIPESAKPRIYEKSRQIVMAESLLPAIVGASILAVMVNFIELLCTAGLPAMYSAILARQNLPAWGYYAYLLLYNVAYMFDDSLMVAIVVTTLGKRKLQETEGRWLKLVGGAVILTLGVVMLVRPDLLV